jgi:DNA invertase Pin-like site-specific DNA recombinase
VGRERQLRANNGNGGVSRVYREKVSGAKVDRKELGKLLKAITTAEDDAITDPGSAA